MKIFSIGHSTHQIKDFISILQSYPIRFIVDVRTIPKSRYVPWFNAKQLQASLRKHNIRYLHFPLLGGLRKTTKASINKAWRNPSFRGYADYMQTKEFHEGLKKLIALIKLHKDIAIMCAEAVPWRCHRSLIADALLIRKIKVIHVINKKSSKSHTLTTFSKINRNKRPIQIYYPLEDSK
jgi:uncharacterized protein (DUF488 family)